jgi:hypothetical protein
MNGMYATGTCGSNVNFNPDEFENIPSGAYFEAPDVIGMQNKPNNRMAEMENRQRAAILSFNFDPRLTISPSQGTERNPG